MRRFMPIQLLIALILGSMALLLGMSLLQAQRSSEARLEVVELTEQRLAARRIAWNLARAVEELRREARLFASTGKTTHRQAHAATLRELIARQRIVREGHASLPQPAPPVLGEFADDLAAAGIEDAERNTLLRALQKSVALGQTETSLLAGPAAAGELMWQLNSLALEARAPRAAFAALADAVDRRVASAVAERNRRVDALEAQQYATLGALVMLVVVSFLGAHRYAVAPLRELLNAATAIGGGAYDTRAPVFGVREITELATTLNWMAESFQADLEARRAAEQHARAMEARLRQVSDLTPGVLWEIRLDTKNRPVVTFVGGDYEELFAVDRERVTQNFDALIEAVHPDDRRAIASAIRRAIETAGDFQDEHRSLRQDGQYRWTRTYGRRTTLADGTPVWSGFSVDMHEIKELRQKLEGALSAAEAANRSKSQFLANLSHEIRTPMNAILGMTHLSLQTELNGRQREYLRRIDSASRMLLRIINDILDVSKIEAGRMELEQAEFSLDQMLESVSDVVGIRAQEKGIELVFAVDPDVPRTLLGDALRLGQVLINLIGNAIKFTEQGQVKLSVELKSREAGSAQLGFQVEDSGIGIAPEKLDTLFQAFTQADASTTRQFGGTGLGLTIARQLVRLMGGDISVRSELGQGSTFAFEIRLAVDEDGVRLLNQTATSLGRLRCLVIDDSRSSRSILLSTLQYFGFETVGVNSGLEALEKVRERSFDCVLCDWRMPDMDGVETARQLRQLVGEDTRIILVTGYGRDELLQELDEEIAIDGVLLKPVGASVLLDTIAGSHGRGRESLLAPQEPAPDIPDLTDRTVLLAEDNSISRELAEELLQQTGVGLKLAANGEEALAILAQENVDLILLDLQMPVMNGWEAATAIREQLAFQDLPILAMSAENPPDIRERCQAAGISDFVPKPIDVPAFYRQLAEWLGSRERRASDRSRRVGGHLELPGVDARAGLARASFNRDLYLGLLQRLAAQFGDWPGQLQAALSAEDLPRLHHLAHALKGAAANLGANHLSGLAAALESLHGEELSAAPQIIADIQQGLVDLQAAMPTAQPSASPAAGAEERVALDGAALKTLRALILAGDSEARRLARQLQTQGRATAVLGRIQAHLAAYEFEQAAELLPELEQALA